MAATEPVKSNEEYQLDADSELRFEIETKNEKVTAEVSYIKCPTLYNNENNVLPLF